MGCHSSKELKKEPIKKNQLSSVNSLKTEVLLSPEDIKNIRSSWKEMAKKGDFKTHGINMMIK